MRPFITFALEAFPLSGVRREALYATLADWRYEAAAASTGLGRLAVALRSTAAVLRAVLALATRDLVTEWRRPWLRRLAVALAIAIAALGTLGPLDAAIRIIPLFPFVVFVAEVTGRRDRPGVGLGGALLLAVFSLLLVSVVSPELLEYKALLDWREQGQASAIERFRIPWQWVVPLRAGALAMHVVATAALAGALRAGPRRGYRCLMFGALVFAPMTGAIIFGLINLGAPIGFVQLLLRPLLVLASPPLFLTSGVMLLVAAALRRVDQR